MQTGHKLEERFADIDGNYVFSKMKGYMGRKNYAKANSFRNPQHNGIAKKNNLTSLCHIH